MKLASWVATPRETIPVWTRRQTIPVCERLAAPRIEQSDALWGASHPGAAQQLLVGCFQKWDAHVTESRYSRLEYSHAVAQLEAEIEAWNMQLLCRYVFTSRLMGANPWFFKQLCRATYLVTCAGC